MTAPGKLQQHNKLLGLDHLRAFAITIVFLFHYGGIFSHPEWVRTFGKFGWTGVDLFFALSGYLISSQLFLKIVKGEKISFPVFFAKRFFRIIPAYLVVVTIYFLIPSFREREGLAPLWKYLTFTQNIGLDLRTQGTFSHAWSLCIEEQFYLLLPVILITLVYLKINKKGFIILLLLFVAGFAARIYCWDTLIKQYGESDDFTIYWYKWIYYPTYARLDGLLVGVSIAALFQFRSQIKTKLQKYGNWLLLGGLFIFSIAYLLNQEEKSFGATIFGFPLIALGYGIIVTGAILPSSFLYKVNSKITSTIATLSYSIYLTHKIVIHITQEQFSKLHIDKDGNLMLLICIVTSLVAAFAMNKIVEKPFLKLRGKVLGK